MSDQRFQAQSSPCYLRANQQRGRDGDRIPGGLAGLRDGREMRPVRLVAGEWRVDLALDNLKHALITIRLWATSFPEICIAQLAVTGQC